MIKTLFSSAKKFLFSKKNKSGQKVLFSPYEYIFVVLNKQSIDIYLTRFQA